MKKKNIVYGDISTFDVVINEEEKEMYNENKEVIGVEVNGMIELITKPVRKKVVLVKLPNHKYIEAIKLKTTKDLIEAYIDAITQSEKICMNTYSNNVELNMVTKDHKTTGEVKADEFVDESTIEPFYIDNKGRVNVKTLTNTLSKK